MGGTSVWQSLEKEIYTLYTESPMIHNIWNIFNFWVDEFFRAFPVTYQLIEFP
jgi:hypothetical protein